MINPQLEPQLEQIIRSYRADFDAGVITAQDLTLAQAALAVINYTKELKVKIKELETKVEELESQIDMENNYL